jgi:cobalt-zinc-cadmium efflux system membrane fusion protein
MNSHSNAFRAFSALLGLVFVAAVAATIYFFHPLIHDWSNGPKGDSGAAEKDKSHELVRDAKGHPVQPFTMRLSPVTAKALQVTTEAVKPAGKLTLPSQVGTLGYDTDHLFSVRPRFQGEIIKIGDAADGPNDYPWTPEQRYQKRPLGPGDRVKKGDLLAVVWSKELGDRKVALVSALLDLYLDRETLQRLEPIYERGSLPEATYRLAVNKVEKDLSAVYAAESSLGISRLTPEEVEKIRDDAKAIQKRLQGKPETPEQRKERMAQDFQKWARVDLVAPQDGIIVEKNTNVNDIVDPARDTPLFRIADLRWLLIYVNFNEEYLPILEPILRASNPGLLEWKVRLEADPDARVLTLPILRVAPSLDPNQHTAMVIGRISNPVIQDPLPPKYLLAGQFVTATVELPAAAGLVDIPTNALNEVNGQSLVFVQRNPDRPEYTLRRVVVVRRTREVVQVRSELNAAEQHASQEEVRQGRRPFETLQPGDLLVTRGVTEMTDALEDLVARERAEK